MYLGLYMRFCSWTATPGRILHVSTNLLQIQISDPHLAFSEQQQMLSVYHGDAFYPSEKHSWSNFLEKKRAGKEWDKKLWHTNRFVQFSICNPETAILSTVWKTFSWKRAQRAVSVSLGDTHFYCSRLYLSKDRGLDPRCHRGTNWDGLWCLYEIQAQTGATFRGRQFSLLPSKHSSASHSQPRVLPDPRAAFLPQPTNRVLHLYHPSKHFGGMMSGLWEPQCHHSGFPVSIYWSHSILLLTDSYL